MALFWWEDEKSSNCDSRLIDILGWAGERGAEVTYQCDEKMRFHEEVLRLGIR